MSSKRTEISFENTVSIIEARHAAENRTDEFYAVAQLLAIGELSKEQQQSLGTQLMKMMETDNWWRSNGGFNDE
jgi:hypothetical protein